MQIYFAGSIRGGRDDQALYQEIIAKLGVYGQVLTEHVGNKDLSAKGEMVSEEYIFTRDVEWLKAAEVVVAEVTSPSLGVGYELGKAEEWGKRVLCLYRPSEGKKLSAMILGNKIFAHASYQTVAELDSIFKNFFNSL